MLSFLRKRKILIVSIVLAVIVVTVALRANGNGDMSTTSPRIDDLVRTVKVSGKVVPINDVSLGFEIGGTVSRVNYDVGQTVPRGAVIVELDQSSLAAELAEARAALAKIDGGGLYTTKTENARRAVVQAIAEAYTQADDAVHNRADQVFDDPRTQNPEILFAFDDITLRDSINLRRPLIEDVLADWKVLVNKGYSSYSDADLALAKSYASSVSQFLDEVARAVSKFKTSSALSQTTIDKYRADIAVGRQNLNNSMSALISEGDKLRDTLSDVPVQAARVALAESRLAKSRVVAPFTGIVSRQDAEVGETVSVGSSLVRLISESYEVETYVPEVSIAGLSVGNPAQITLDAYDSSQAFNARVSAIDPAETIRDGVSTYRVTLTFTAPDPRIRSGMTANIDIETARVSGALLIPERTVVRDGDASYVFVRVGEKNTDRRDVTLGERDSSGNVAVLSGLSEGDLVLINPPKE